MPERLVLENRGSKQATAQRESAAKNTHAKVFDVLSAIAPGGCVLDIPCGSGAFTKRLVEGTYTAYAADLERHPALPDAEFRAADMNEALPFDDGAMDAVVSIEGIEHIQRPHDFIRECRRVVRPGGHLILTTPNISSLRSRWRYLLTGFHNKCKYPLDEAHPEPRHHITMISFPELRYMLHTNGFRIEKIAANRAKAANWLYAPLAIAQAVVTICAFRRAAKNEEHGAIIAGLRRQMLEKSVLFGESIIVVAQAID
jgi:2-polyprenyl-3-methyl-5-hydroxy-6-metoxy-1,4-benzoquinol methylase